jgi:hypothetical protein
VQKTFYQLYNFYFCSYGDNPKLHKAVQDKKHFKLLLGISIGVLVLLLLVFIGSLLLMRNLRRKAFQQNQDDKGLYAHRFHLVLFM